MMGSLVRCVLEEIRFTAVGFVNIKLTKMIILKCHNMTKCRNTLKSCVFLFHQSDFNVAFAKRTVTQDSLF